MSTITDDFNRANENPLSNGGVWEAGTSWFNGAPVTQNNIQLAANAVQATVLDGSSLNLAMRTGIGADQFTGITISTLTGAAVIRGGPAVRFNAPGNDPTGYVLVVSINDATVDTTITRFDGASATDIASENATAWAATDKAKIRASGGVITGLRNGTTLLGGVNDATYGSGRVGMDFSGPPASSGSEANFKFDDFLAGDTADEFPSTSLMAQICL